MTISESAAVGSRVALPSARDPDAGSNGVRAYRLADVPAEAGVPATGEVRLDILNTMLKMNSAL